MGKNLYITTAIPYVNGKPHIGNALDYLLADIWARYQRMNGKTVRFQVGTDEHGNKIAQKALDAGMDPKAYTDSMYGNFEELMKKVNATYTDFVRTTDPHHIGAVQYIWQQLQPYIYKGTYEGWYCQGCESFVTDKEATANNGVCADHQTPYERLGEDNYYLRISDFTEQIREAIEKNRMRIVPEYRKREFLELIKDGLQDVSISRPRKHLSWGVSVPGDPDQVMYVWLDALSNYLTVLGYPDKSDWRDFWPAEVQVIGKDILRFHAGIWPAMLLGLGIDLPRTLLVHGHVNVSGSKMSKSVGNVIDPNEVIDNYGADAFRYYFARHIPTQDDGDFTWEKFENAYNNELGNDLGNVVQRVASMITRYQSGVIGEMVAGEHDMQPYRLAMDELAFDRALNEAWVTVRSLNKYIEDVKPWEIAKRRETETDAEEHLADVLSHSVGTIMQISDLLSPFMPDTSEKINKLFGSGIVQSAGVLFPKIYLHTPDPRTPRVAK
ncbi:methionine--tRNA ligase [Candidatus Saccharibacteria bacterium]|nr:methionine--tRNA ligase [Candidatus Saccharibacteria bacterium]